MSSEGRREVSPARERGKLPDEGKLVVEISDVVHTQSDDGRAFTSLLRHSGDERFGYGRVTT